MTEKTTTAYESMRESFIELVGGVIILAILFGFVWALTPDSIKYPIFYAIEYHVDWSKVHYEKQPVDCDWGHAPIGDKDCHYERRVMPAKTDNGTVTDVFVTWEKVSN